MNKPFKDSDGLAAVARALREAAAAAASGAGANGGGGGEKMEVKKNVQQVVASVEIQKSVRLPL